MSIDARVASVNVYDDDSGYLELIDRPAQGESSAGIAGQRKLYFDRAPNDVKLLEGCDIWGPASCLMLGDIEIAKRQASTSIVFGDPAKFTEALEVYQRTIEERNLRNSG